MVAAGGLVGFLEPEDFGFLVVKVSGDNGAEIWRQDTSLDPPANDVSFDAAGDALVGGSDGTSAVVLKLSGASGTELWRYTIIPGFPGLYGGDFAGVVRHDAAGDVIAAAVRAYKTTGETATVVKLAGSSGMELWRRDFPGLSLSYTTDIHGVIAIDQAGDVVLEGFTTREDLNGLYATRSVIKLSGVDGTDVWRFDSTEHKASNRPRVALLPSGDVLAADADFVLVALASSDGHELWRRALGGAAGGALDALTMDAANDILAIGSTTIVKLAATDGGEIWRRQYTGSTPGNFVASALIAAPAGRLVAAGSVLSVPDGHLPPRPPGDGRTASFTVLGFSAANGALELCTDGYVDPGEQCDDGNDVDGDCCSTMCRPAPDGTPCDDRDRCTMQDACEQGVCRPGPTPLPCEPCGHCDPQEGCITRLPFDCRVPTASESAVIRFDHHRGTRHDELAWKWASGEATSRKDFADPLAATGYALCVFGYDGILVNAAVPPNSACPRRASCWQATPRGFSYRGRPKNSDGISHISLRAGGPGRATVTVRGRGDRLGLPSLPIEGPLKVQLRKLDGTGPCWSAEHDVVRTNRRDRFVALSH